MPYRIKVELSSDLISFVVHPNIGFLHPLDKVRPPNSTLNYCQTSSAAALTKPNVLATKAMLYGPDQLWCQTL